VDLESAALTVRRLLQSRVSRSYVNLFCVSSYCLRSSTSFCRTLVLATVLTRSNVSFRTYERASFPCCWTFGRNSSIDSRRFVVDNPSNDPHESTLSVAVPKRKTAVVLSVFVFKNDICVYSCSSPVEFGGQL